MINQYHAAQLLELGTARALVLGNKELAPVIDCHTIQFGTRCIDWLSDEE